MDFDDGTRRRYPPATALADHVTAAADGVQHPPVTPGKVAMWLFLATEIMFFTGLIGSYIVLRAGSPRDRLFATCTRRAPSSRTRCSRAPRGSS